VKSRCAGVRKVWLFAVIHGWRSLLCHFQLATVLQIRRNADRAEGMIADPFYAGRFHAPADDAAGVL
jgi:hypothetical protein